MSGMARPVPPQRWETEGVASLSRDSLATRFFMWVVRHVELANVRWSRFGNPCVYATDLFPWTSQVESEWPAIRSELDSVLERRNELPEVQKITTDAAAITTDSNWKVFVFTAYGVRSALNIRSCPATWRVVGRIPGLRTAMFSILEPGKRLPPHRGPYNGVLRLHLGLKIPEPRERSAIRVGNEVLYWDEGKCLIFDDAYEHEAWNETSEPRVVLFVDFERPLRFPINVINRLMLALARFTPFLKEGEANLRQWERAFYRREADVARRSGS